MVRKNTFYILLTMVVAIVSLIIAVKMVFKNGNINEGKFRVRDVLMSSYVDVENKSKTSGAWTINLSQNNVLSLLIARADEAKVEKIYLKNVSSDKESIYIFQQDSENRLKVGENRNLELEIDDENMLLELNIVNENILKNYDVSKVTNEIIYDGRIFNMVGIKYNDIKFRLEFELVIVEQNGKTNTMKASLELPKEELMTNGLSVTRLNTSNFVFKVK